MAESEKKKKKGHHSGGVENRRGAHAIKGANLCQRIC